MYRNWAILDGLHQRVWSMVSAFRRSDQDVPIVSQLTPCEKLQKSTIFSRH